MNPSRCIHLALALLLPHLLACGTPPLDAPPSVSTSDPDALGSSDETTLTASPIASLSLDAFVRQTAAGADLHVVDPATRSVRITALPPSFDSLLLSPDRRQAIIVTRTPPPSRKAFEWVTLASGASRTLTVTPGDDVAGNGIGFAPNSRWFAFTLTRQGVARIVVEGLSGARFELALPSEARHVHTLAWSPDSRRLIAHYSTATAIRGFGAMELSRAGVPKRDFRSLAALAPDETIFSIHYAPEGWVVAEVERNHTLNVVAFGPAGERINVRDDFGVTDLVGVVFSPVAPFASFRSGTTLYQLELATPNLLSDPTLHGSILRWSRSGWLITDGAGGALSVRRTADLGLIRTIAPPSSARPPINLRWSADRRGVVVTFCDWPAGSSVFKGPSAHWFVGDSATETAAVSVIEDIGAPSFEANWLFAPEHHPTRPLVAYLKRRQHALELALYDTATRQPAGSTGIPGPDTVTPDSRWSVDGESLLIVHETAAALYERASGNVVVLESYSNTVRVDLAATP
ncbi:MAG: hypothetical protein IT381_23315 [Deltaproteobacteria bacterium]|nr:hypothetical protein [Deltaproteobacteria bacterium]